MQTWVRQPGQFPQRGQWTPSCPCELGFCSQCPEALLLSLQASPLPPVEGEASDSFHRTSRFPSRTDRVPLIPWCSVFFLALKDSSKRSINSDWKIELPGEFQIAGTTVRYVRRGLWEKISAKGPTKIPLHLMVTWCALAFVCKRSFSFLLPWGFGCGGGEAPGSWWFTWPPAAQASLLIFAYLIAFVACFSILTGRPPIFFKRNRLQEGNA